MTLIEQLYELQRRVEALEDLAGRFQSDLKRMEGILGRPSDQMPAMPTQPLPVATIDEHGVGCLEKAFPHKKRR
jgi:hypothetical protein